MLLEEGAKTAVKTCMGVKPDEDLVILSDDSTLNIGKKLKEAAFEITDHVEFFNLDSYGNRPLSTFPDVIKNEVERADVTFWTAHSYEGELESVRQPFIENALAGGRHGHMVNVTKKVMECGMTVDYNKISEFTNHLAQKAKDVDTIRVKNEQGTDIEVTFSDKRRWVPSDGIYHEPNHWGNLPDGEVYTAPLTMEGKIVVDGLLGDYFPNKFPHSDLVETPLTVMVENNEKPHSTQISCDNDEIEKEVKDYLSKHECSSIVGEFGLGTNIFLENFSNNSLLDEKYPGVHIALGDPLGGDTGADWKCPEHLDMILTKCDVWFDDEMIMENGEYLIR
ncbi:MAG: aminopeptidase [Candidatus Thermoplasmatota archaeon]|nr:aminopeptidase [Candidatus Thermoplasmatota archaeon]MBS3789541.1 aminopeptidase [Candidatus Thermoplasmatota archaeon]